LEGAAGNQQKSLQYERQNHRKLGWTASPRLQVLEKLYPFMEFGWACHQGMKAAKMERWNPNWIPAHQVAIGSDPDGK
jgi:hypothetical protein